MTQRNDEATRVLIVGGGAAGMMAALYALRGGASVTAAATNAGFSDCSHFIVLFKKKFGQTPLEYKKLCLP